MTTTKAPALPDVLAHLIASHTPAKRPLSGGLVLAYTPGSCNQAEPGVFRLTLSRRGVWPSEEEIETVKRDLKVALGKSGRILDGGLFVEPWLKGRPTSRPGQRVFYHVVFWREMRQASLL